MTWILDLFDFDSDTRDGRPRRKGLGGLFERLTAAIGDDDAGDEERPRQGERASGDQRRRRDDDGFDFFD